LQLAERQLAKKINTCTFFFFFFSLSHPPCTTFYLPILILIFPDPISPIFQVLQFFKQESTCQKILVFKVQSFSHKKIL
jgi:hypothetical protein